MSSYDPIGPEKSDPFPPDAYQSPGAPVEEEKRGPGCLFWGCLISAILMILLIILIVVGVFVARNMAINFLEQYTEPQPAELPVVALSEEERAAVIEDWEAFREAVENGEPAELRVEDSDRLNVIAQDLLPEAEGRVYLTIEGDQLKGECSFPIDAAGEFLVTDRLDGRYLNFQGTFDVFIRNGSLFVTLQNGSIKGEPLPAEFLSQMRNQNLAEDATQDPEMAAILRRLELEIEDGAMVLRAQGADADDAEAPAEADAAETEAEAGEPSEEPASEPAPKSSDEAGGEGDSDSEESGSESKTETETKTKTETEPEAEPEPAGTASGPSF